MAYFNTTLGTEIALHPSQMDNNIYKHLKNNLIRRYQGKCFNKYGYISKIYKIESYTGGQINPEDSTASALYHIKFSCKLCHPLTNSIITCEVMGINKSIIYLQNGPIHILLFEGKDLINQEKFTYDDRRNTWLANIGDKKAIPIVAGVYINIKVINVLMKNGSDVIIVYGSLEGLATDNERNESIRVREDDDIKILEYDKFITETTTEISETEENKF